jgi:3-oxoacyl-[acyl-carrier-protein] synthase III
VTLADETRPVSRTRRTPRRPTQAGLFGVGAALPPRLITNDEWAQRLDTSDEWIQRRTGIRERYWLADGEPLADLAADACVEALADAGRDAGDVDLVLVSTITPDRVTPGLAPEVARLIGATNAGACDVSAACAGFLYALNQAAALVESGRARTVLVCGAEALSRLTDATDRGTAVLFGDGAGAVVVGAGDFDLGLGAFSTGADGDRADLLYADLDERMLRMSGQEVYRHAVERMVQSMHGALADAGLTPADLDLFVAHQANGRILEAAARGLGLAEDRVVLDMGRVANTSSASIPLALHEAQRTGRLQPGATLGLAAFGAGFVWAAGVVRWKERAGVCL